MNEMVWISYRVVVVTLEHEMNLKYTSEVELTEFSSG